MNLLLENLLRIEATKHREVQEQARKILRSLGYYVKLEKKIWTGREGKIDVFARKGNYSIGIEVEHSTIRKKSIEKLNVLKPSLAIFLLKGNKINKKGNYLRLKLIKINSLLLHLSTKEVQKISVAFEKNVSIVIQDSIFENNQLPLTYEGANCTTTEQKIDELKTGNDVVFCDNVYDYKVPFTDCYLLSSTKCSDP